MPNRSSLSRFKIYYKKKGFFGTILRLFQEPYQMAFRRTVVLLYADLNEVNDSTPPLPPGIKIECKKTYSEAIQKDMQKLVNYWKEEDLLNETKDRFNKGAILWVLTSNGDIAAFSWSIIGKTVRPWYLPITPDDVYVFGAFTFPEYRGRGFHPLLAKYRLNEFKMQGIHRAVAEIHTWNESALRLIEKTCWHVFGKAQRFRIFGRNITIWKQ